MKLPVTAPASASAEGDLWRGRKLLLLAALVLVSVVNVARIVRLQEYFVQLSQGDASSSDEHGNAVRRARRPHSANCMALEKHHVDPNFYSPDVCLTRAEVLTTIKHLVFTAAETFTRHNVTYFLDSGTLLGAFREKGVIAHDNDADVGIDAAGLAYIQQQPLEFPPQYFFTVWNSSLYPTSDRDDKLPARLIDRESGIYLDVFAFLDWPDASTGVASHVGPLPSWCFMNCAGCPTVESGGKSLRVAREWIYPLVDCTFEGDATLKCPHMTETYLRYTFGKSFMRPIKYTYGR